MIKKIPSLLIAFLISLYASAQAPKATVPDARIKLHYTQEQVDEIMKKDPKKIEKLNYYFQASYRIFSIQSGKDYSAFDIVQYEHLRREDQRVQVGLGRDGSVLELYSLKEMQEAYQLIESK